MLDSSEYTKKCVNKRNIRKRAENDYNRVLNEYIMLKYEPISQEFNEFYDVLKDKYPNKSVYKGSKKFRVWVQDEIKKYDAGKNHEGENIVVEDVQNIVDEGVQNIAAEDVQNIVAEGVQNIVAEDVQNIVAEGVQNIVVEDEGVQNIVVEGVQNIVAGGASLNEIVESTIGANAIVPEPLENIIANGAPLELEELDALIGNIIADIENQCDEGISLSPRHDLEVEPFYYDHEIEGLDDIELDMPADMLEAYLEIELENF